MAERLLPCPFCGVDAYKSRSIDGTHIQCVNTETCRVDVDVWNLDAAEAIAIWNTRANTLQTPVDSDVREALMNYVGWEENVAMAAAAVAPPEIMVGNGTARGEIYKIVLAALAQKDKVQP